MNIQSSFTVYTAALHALILNPLLLAYFWLGLSWIDSIDSISANKRFSPSKTSSRKPYSNSKQQEKQKHSAENTINFSLSGRGELHGGARVTTLVTLRKCTLGNKREIKTLKFVLASAKGFKGGLAWIKPSKKDMAVTFSYYLCTTESPGQHYNCHTLIRSSWCL